MKEDTRNFEIGLSNTYGYKKLPDELSKKVRKYYFDNVPSYLSILGSSEPLYTIYGTKVCDCYNRIVIGDYGAFLEFDESQVDCNFIIKKGQEYRVNDPKYKNNVKYIWLTVDDGSDIKIYKQLKTVTYADYKPGKYYVSVHEIYTCYCSR